MSLTSEQRAAPKVSVCIPVYNGAAYIGESIGSVLEQSFRDYELIVCDNCSSDPTESIVRGFADPRLTYVRNDRNLGLVGNFNRCVDLARGEYVYLWHHDDVMLPGNLERKVHLLDAHPAVGLVHSNILQVDAGGTVLSEHWAPDSRRDYVEDGRAYFARLVLDNNIVCCPSVLVRRSCYARLGPYRTELPYVCDWEMWLRLALFYDVACVGSPLIKYRRHSTAEAQKFEGLAGVEQEYLLKRLVFLDYGHLLQNARRLRGEALARTARRALSRAYDAFWADDRAVASRGLGLALRAHVRIARTAAFWRLATRLVLGPEVAHLYRRLKAWRYERETSRRTADGRPPSGTRRKR